MTLERLRRPLEADLSLQLFHGDTLVVRLNQAFAYLPYGNKNHEPYVLRFEGLGG